MEATQRTVNTLIELDEPEALLMTLRKAAVSKASSDHWNGCGVEEAKRWLALAQVLGDAEIQLDLILNPKVAGPDFRPEATAPWPPAGLRPSTMEASAQSFVPAADAPAKTE